MIFKPPIEKNFSRLIDANLDRAREGLRVIEDWCRFSLNRGDLVLKIKDWRHQLSSHHHEFYKQARSTSTDQGALLDHPEQRHRTTSDEIIAANCSRVQEALRVLEEFARTSDPDLATTAAKIRYKIYGLEITLLKSNIRINRIRRLQESNLYLITNSQQDLLQTISSSLSAGIRMIQYRCKSLNDQEKVNEAQALSNLCKEQNVLLIINDRIDIALAVDADGVHLGQGDIPTTIARKLLGENRIIGRSTHSLEDLNKAHQENCDYIGVGPAFPSRNKKQTKPIGISYLAEIYRKSHLPCFAIGGINTSNISELTQKGVKRIAVIDAIMNSDNPSVATHHLLKKLS